MTVSERASGKETWHTLTAADAAAHLGVQPDLGLSAQDVEQRLATYGPNQLPTEPPPSRWAIARGQVSNPMNIMLLIVAVASFAIGQVATGIFVVAAGVVQRRSWARSQERKALASVEALAQLQVPQGPGAPRRGASRRSTRPGSCRATSCLLEAGDLVPADGRIVTSATSGGAGGGAHRRERAGRQGRRDAAAEGDARSATGRTWCSRTPR